MWIMIVPFLFLATISQGTMLEAGPAGVRIVLCTGDGMVEAVMAADGQVRSVNDADHGGHPQPQPCDWALHGQAALADEGPAPLPMLLLELGADYVIDIPLHARRVDVLTPAARGPPSLI